MNENPYAASVDTSYPLNLSDVPGESLPLTVGHLTFALVCGVLVTATSLFGVLVITVQWLTALVGASVPGGYFFVHRLVSNAGPAVAFGCATWQLWHYRQATLMKNRGTIGWQPFTLQHNRFWQMMTIAVVILFAFRVFNSVFVALLFR